MQCCKNTKKELPNAPTREMNKSILGMAAAKSTIKGGKMTKKMIEISSATNVLICNLQVTRTMNVRNIYSAARSLFVYLAAYFDKVGHIIGIGT